VQENQKLGDPALLLDEVGEERYGHPLALIGLDGKDDGKNAADNSLCKCY